MPRKSKEERAEYYHQYYLAHKAKIKARTKTYRRKHNDETKEKRHEYYMQYYAAHKEEIRALRRAYYAEHREEMRQYYWKMRERLLAAAKDRYQENKIAISVKGKLRREHKLLMEEFLLWISEDLHKKAAKG